MPLLRQELEDVYEQLKEEAMAEVKGQYEAEITSYIDEIVALREAVNRLRKERDG